MIAHTSATPMFEMNALVPSITQWLPSRRARVVIAELSDPAPGSVIAIPPRWLSLARLELSLFRSEVPAHISSLS